MKRAKCPCCGAEDVGAEMALRAVRGTWDRFVGLTTSPGSRISRCGCSRGAGSFTRLPSTSCIRTCSVRPAGGRSTVRSRARSGRTSGWAARTPRTRLRLGSPFFPCRPTTISTRSTGPARHHPSAGATGPYGGAEPQRYVSPLATLKSTLCVL